MSNKLIINCLSLFLIINCTDKPSGFVYRGMFVSDKFQIDGCLDESAWQQAQEIILSDNLTGKEIEALDQQTKVRSCYDRENLYIAFECNDKDIWATFSKRDEYLWKEEVVEVFIDTDDDPNNYIEIEVSPSGVLFDSFIINPEHINFVETAKFDLPHIQTAVSVDGTLNDRNDRDKKWVVEIAIPFKDMVEMGFPEGFAGKRWKINFYRINRDGNKKAGKYAWSPTLGSFHTPSKFGIYFFKQ